MRVRVNSALSDLHATDGRYHVSCMTSFMSSRSVSYASKKSEESCSGVEDDVAFDTIVSTLSKDKSKIWNSFELFDLYQQYGGNEKKRSLIRKLNDHFEDDVAILA